MKSVIAEARQVYKSAGLDCGHGLLPPADEAAIERLEAALSLQMPRELRELYNIHGGQEYVDPGITGLFGEHRLHTPDEIVALHTCYVENYLFALGSVPTFPPEPDQEGHWVTDLIPFASWDAYALCIHAATGEVWEFIPSSGLIRHRPSIEAVLREVIESVLSGKDAQLGATRLFSNWI